MYYKVLTANSRYSAGIVEVDSRLASTLVFIAI